MGSSCDWADASPDWPAHWPQETYPGSCPRAPSARRGKKYSTSLCSRPSCSGVRHRHFRLCPHCEFLYRRWDFVHPIAAMANAVAMAGLCGAMVESSLVSGMNLSSNSSSSRASVKPAMLAARSQQQSEDNSSAVQGRRSMLSLLATSVVGAVLVKEASAATSIKVEGPPPPSGGLRTCRCTNFHPISLSRPYTDSNFGQLSFASPQFCGG